MLTGNFTWRWEIGKLNSSGILIQRVTGMSTAVAVQRRNFVSKTTSVNVEFVNPYTTSGLQVPYPFGKPFSPKKLPPSDFQPFSKIMLELLPLRKSPPLISSPVQKTPTRSAFPLTKPSRCYLWRPSKSLSGVRASGRLSVRQDRTSQTRIVLASDPQWVFSIVVFPPRKHPTP